MQGQGEAGLAQMHQGMAAVLATGQRCHGRLLVLLAEAAGYAGQVEEGLRLLAEALTAFEASGRGDLLAEAYRLQGELLLRQAIPDAAQAEACFQQALAIARRQQAKSWELRAAMSLSRLWQQQGKRDEARDLLAPVYGWFTEGFDTADLQEAKALLHELASSRRQREAPNRRLAQTMERRCTQVEAIARERMNPLPNYEEAVIEDSKFMSYALNPQSDRGQHKARVFESALGFNLIELGTLEAGHFGRPPFSACDTDQRDDIRQEV